MNFYLIPNTYFLKNTECDKTSINKTDTIIGTISSASSFTGRGSPNFINSKCKINFIMIMCKKYIPNALWDRYDTKCRAGNNISA